MEAKLRDRLKAAGVSENTLDAALDTFPKPDAAKWKDDPQYLRDLLNRAGIGTRFAADLIGISNRVLRHYLSGTKKHPYSVQFALEVLADLNTSENNPSRNTGENNDR